MDAILQVLQFFFSMFQGGKLSEQLDKYNAAVDAQIQEGKDLYSARIGTAMQMIQTNPNFTEAKAMLESLPKEARAEVDRIGAENKRARGEFLSNYDTRTGQYLNKSDQDTAAMIAKFGGQAADISTGYGQREADVMGLLQGQGNQALKDNRRTFGEQSAAALGNLTERGLSGSTVGSSVRSGFATREADQAARIREAVAAQKAGALTGLRGDTLGWGERAATLGAGMTSEGINRRLGAYANNEAARAGYDYNWLQSGADRRSAALNTAYGFDQGLAGYLGDQGRYQVGAYLDSSGDLANYVGGGPIQHVPPDPTGFYNSMSSSGYGLGYR